MAKKERERDADNRNIYIVTDGSEKHTNHWLGLKFHSY